MSIQKKSPIYSGFFMVNNSGNILQEADCVLSINNRGFNYGDAIFETIKVSHSKILFLED